MNFPAATSSSSIRTKCSFPRRINSEDLRAHDRSANDRDRAVDVDKRRHAKLSINVSGGTKAARDWDDRSAVGKGSAADLRFFRRRRQLSARKERTNCWPLPSRREMNGGSNQTSLPTSFGPILHVTCPQSAWADSQLLRCRRSQSVNPGNPFDRHASPGRSFAG